MVAMVGGTIKPIYVAQGLTNVAAVTKWRAPDEGVEEEVSVQSALATSPRQEAVLLRVRARVGERRREENEARATRESHRLESKMQEAAQLQNEEGLAEDWRRLVIMPQYLH